MCQRRGSASISSDIQPQTGKPNILTPHVLHHHYRLLCHWQKVIQGYWFSPSTPRRIGHGWLRVRYTPPQRGSGTTYREQIIRPAFSMITGGFGVNHRAPGSAPVDITVYPGFCQRYGPLIDDVAGRPKMMNRSRNGHTTGETTSGHSGKKYNDDSAFVEYELYQPHVPGPPFTEARSISLVIHPP